MDYTTMCIRNIILFWSTGGGKEGQEGLEPLPPLLKFVTSFRFNSTLVYAYYMYAFPTTVDCKGHWIVVEGSTLQCIVSRIHKHSRSQLSKHDAWPTANERI